MKKILFIAFFVLSFFSNAQTWSNDVAQIVFNKCSKCHHPGGIAPSSMMSYQETSPMAAAIYSAVSQDQMPPWPPDNNYAQYLHDRSLTPSEKSTILNWCSAGAPEGIAANTPPAPVFSSESILGPGDLTVQIPKYMSKATAQSDDYACFAIPSGLTQGRTIKSVEIIPGNRQIVHHALIYVDPLGVELSDTIGGNCASPSNSTTKLIAGYTPGATPMVLPSTSPLKLGIDMASNSTIYFAMHYPAGSYGQFDSTKVIFHFYPQGTTGVRQVMADPIIQNWSFSLANNQPTTVTGQYPSGSGTLGYNISVLSAFPHMHLLGQTIKSFAIDPLGDTVKFISIPQWDFHWQDFYFFKNLKKVPQGSKIKGLGTYFNNTGSVVNAGLNTSDEMFLVYFHYMLYMPGDETYDMDALMAASLDEQLMDDESPISVYPNPFDNSIKIECSAVQPGDVMSIFIYDYQGRLIRKIINSATMIQQDMNITWDGLNDSGSEVKDGVYFVSIVLNGKQLSKQIIKN